MTDLFANQPRPLPRVGHSNALFLADLAINTPDATLKANIRAGKYPELAMRFVNGWRAMAGRTS